MEINEDLEGMSTQDFWYDLMYGGYIKPEVICADPADAQRVRDAMAVLAEFENSILDEYPDFMQ